MATEALRNQRPDSEPRVIECNAAGIERTILVNGLAPRVGGGLSYLSAQIAALNRVRPDIRVRLLAAPWNAESFKSSVSCDIEIVKVRGLISRLIFEQVILPFLGTHDLLYCPSNFCPIIFRRRPIVLTLQNANHFGPGRWVRSSSALRKRFEIWLARSSVKRADRTVVISRTLLNYVNSDGIPSASLRVVLSGHPSWPSESRKPACLAAQDGPYCLSIANHSPHKNLDDIVSAWGLAFSSNEPTDPRLVIVGVVSEDKRRRQAARLPVHLQGRLHFLGSVSDRAEIKWLISNAIALISASELEASPLTPLEALSLNCPALLSDIPAHRETGGSACCYFPVHDVEQLAVLLREASAGRVIRPNFPVPITWDENARQLSAVFDELI